MTVGLFESYIPSKAAPNSALSYHSHGKAEDLSERKRDPSDKAMARGAMKRWCQLLTIPVNMTFSFGGGGSLGTTR